MGIVGPKSIKVFFFFLIAFSLVFFVHAATNPAYVSPTPANDSQVTGVININFTFTNLTNWTLTGDNGVGELCAANNSASSQNCTWDTSVVGENSYIFILNTTNTTNASDTNITQRTFRVDYPLNIAFVSPTPANNSQVTGLVNINLTFDGTANWTLVADGGVSTPCAGNNSASPQNCIWNATTETEGGYTFNLTVINASNAFDTNSTARTFTVENPINPVFLSPSPNNVSNISGTVTFNITWADDAVFSRIVQRNDGGVWSSPIGSCNLFGFGPQTCTFDTSTVADDSTYEFNLTARDTDNSSDIGTVIVSNITIDNNAPLLSLTGPDNGTAFNTSTINFNWTLSDTIDTNVTCTFVLDASNNETLSNGTNTTKVFADANYDWSVNCTDYTGNTNTSETRTITVDTTVPSFGQINITPNSINNYTNKTPILSLIVNDTNLNLCQYHTGNGTWVNLSFVSAGGDLQLCTGITANQTDGDQLNFTFRALDVANNTATIQPQNLTVDTIAPNILIISPTADLNITDGESFTVTANITEGGANITDGIACNVTIEGDNLLSGTVTYSESTGQCNGSVTLTAPSGIANSNSDINELAVRIDDRANNTGFQNQTIRIDNLGPSIQATLTNTTGDVVESLSQQFILTVQTFDTSFAKNVTVGNATNITLSNITTILNSSAEVWNNVTNATALGCPGTGICTINVYTNDSWGLMNQSSFNLTIDTADPLYQNAGTNASGTIGLKGSVAFFAEWIDNSLNSSTSTTASLRKYNGTAYTVIQTISLNNTLSWSNFTYLPTPNKDEGENNTFDMQYTDFAGRINTTTNFSFITKNSSPVILDVQVLNLINNISNETPAFSVLYADEGKSFASSGVVLNITGANNTTFTKNSLWNCSEENTYNSSLVSESEFINFTTSSYGATNYSFRVTSIVDANFSNATVILERVNYGRVNSSTFSSWNDSVDYEDIRVTLVSTSNTSGNKTMFGFVDLGYTETACNFTAAGFIEGANNVTLVLTDLADNTNTSTPVNWTVDGFRPILTNLNISNATVFSNATLVNQSVNVTSTTELVSVNWTINETTPNTTSIQFWNDGTTLFNDTSGAINNNTLFTLAPGHHLGDFQSYDLFGSNFTTQQYFSVYFNPLNNISFYQNKLFTEANNNVSYLSLDITRNDVNVSGVDSGYLNETIGFNISLNAVTTNVNVTVEGFDGLTYNWNNSFYFSNGTTSSNITESAGINTTFFIKSEGFFNPSTDTKNGTYHYTQFLPTNNSEPNVNWTFNTSGDPFILLMSTPNVSTTNYLLEECVGNVIISSFDDACYTNTSSNYTIFAPNFAGFAIGSDAGAPNVSATFPSTPINDSQFTIFLEVIEPSPNTTGFCDYSLYNNVTAIDVQTLTVANFTLNQSRYTLGVPYTQFLNGNLYELNVTCYDTFGRNSSISLPFNVTDNVSPVISDVNVSNIFSQEVDLFASYSEYGRIRINYSTDENNLILQTDYSDFGVNATVTVDGLAPDTLYFYEIETCDLNGMCSTFPSTGLRFFRTSEVGSSTASGGGGGGSLAEGMVTATHYHGWSELDEGWLRYGVGDEEIAVTSVNVLIENKTFDPFIQISTYFGKPANVPRISPIAYQYFRFEHQGLEGAEYEVEFKVPQDWLTERSSSPEQVQFYRLEQGNWSEYPLTVKSSSDGYEHFIVQLPGFSFFVIKTEGIEPVVENTTNTTPDIPVNVTPTDTIPPDIEPRPPDTQDVNESEGTIAGYEKKNNTWWWIIGVILVLLAVSGGSWYVLTHKPEQKVQEKKLNPDDPFYKLQQYIAHALDQGHNRDQIREKLMSVGWDELVVDEEIEMIMAGRV